MTALARQNGRTPTARWVSDNTRRAYARSLDQLAAWLDENDRDLSDGAIADYVTAMFDAGLAPASAHQVLAALRFRATLEGDEAPIGPTTTLAMSRFARLGADRGRGQARGLQWADADRIAAAAAREGLAGTRDAAVITVMSDGLLRVSEAAAVRVEHVEPARNGATLHVPRSKTDQEGEGRTLFLGLETAAYIARWRGAGAVDDGFLFRAVYRDVVQAGGLSTRTITRIIQRRARECGVDGLSGHSLRVGSAQSLAAGGASLVEMQIAGRWADPKMPARYARAEMAERGAVARLRYGQ